MKRLSLFLMGTIASIALAACGGSMYGGGAKQAAASGGPQPKGRSGQMLVDRSGDALYVNDQEAKSMVLCTGACTAVWRPVTTSSGSVAATGITGLAAITRPDGTTQASLDGKPLYTFYLDSAGKAGGNGAADHFGSQSFTWHVARAGASAAAAGTGTSARGSGMSTSPANGGMTQTAGGATMRY